MASKTKEEKHLHEMNRLEELYRYEENQYACGKTIIGGVDEVGRGPLAGPVVAACVILPKGLKIVGVNDSKKLSEKKRNALYDMITEEAMVIGIGIVDPHTIDEINILQATYQAMKIAIQNLSITPDCILVDGYPIPSLQLFQEAIIGGDGKSISIAAASIIAKVTRDRMMVQFHELYPSYCFDAHKGYGTKKHIDAIKAHGLCPIHRRSFTKNIMTP